MESNNQRDTRAFFSAEKASDKPAESEMPLLEKYQSILSHIESLNMPEGQYIELANEIRDIRNKSVAEKPWEAFDMEITLYNLQTSSLYDSIGLQITSFKESNNSLSAKITMRYSPKGQRLETKEIEVKEIRQFLDTLWELYHPSWMTYEIDGLRNEIDCYKIREKLTKHQQQIFENNLSHHDPEEDDDEEQYSDDDRYQSLWHGYMTLINLVVNRMFVKMKPIRTH